MYGSDRAILKVPEPLGSPTSKIRADDRVHEIKRSSSFDTFNEKFARAPESDDKNELHVCTVSTVSATARPPAEALAVLGSSSRVLKEYHGCSGRKTEGDCELEDEKKKERDHKKRSKNWTIPETFKLIKSRTELDARFVKSGRKAELWDEIAETLHKENVFRDGQQCKDKWEKLAAGYKEVRDGFRDKEDNPFYDDLHQLLSGKWRRREKERDKEDSIAQEKQDNGEAKEVRQEVPKNSVEGNPNSEVNAISAIDKGHMVQNRISATKCKRKLKYISVTELSVVQELLETVTSRQQKFFREVLETMDRKEQIREQVRQEREEKWRAEERAQRCVFNNTMVVLTQRLLGERLGAATVPPPPPIMTFPDGHLEPKKRSKNWKRTEVLQLIKMRGEMDGRFAKSTRRAALWEEIAEKLGNQGIRRDGKQCREKWDKLMAEYKDVTDGRKDQGESSYFGELTAFVTQTVGSGTL